MACFSKITCVLALLLSLALVSKARVFDSVDYSRNKQGFVSIKGSHFTLKGSPFLFNGFNSYWMMTVAADPNMRHQVTEVFRDASAAGMSVCRTWAFADGSSNALHVGQNTRFYLHTQYTSNC
ncbi:Mannan endo-1,4-beta-mannosidase 1 [Heracleum sosnowskyi]|uniref:Mannan endo-1,4-beta-mannosidase 1 n=1 Tax=Heracleum sosnowskyi TaxID=360622 RepID=A0AAD8IM01_9APIA|nr:Mannan endo-1,4-beta-mannosidase 1 [Heracleum sosnowskyi]